MAAKPKSAADFIRSMPTAAASVIVKEAKSAGIDTTAGYVYVVRSVDRKNGVRPKRAAAAKPKRASRDAEFIALAADLGLVRSEQLISQMRASLGGAS